LEAQGWKRRRVRGSTEGEGDFAQGLKSFFNLKDGFSKSLGARGSLGTELDCPGLGRKGTGESLEWASSAASFAVGVQ